VGGIPDLVIVRETGALAKAGDPVALADAIAWLLADEGRRKALGAAGHAKAATEFSPPVVASKHLALYESLLAERIDPGTGPRRGLPRSPAQPLDPAAIHRVLIIRNDEIGDFVLTSPFLRELRKALPGREITLVVKPAVLPLAARCPYADRVLAFDGSTSSGLRFPGSLAAREVEFVRRHLLPRRFDLAVIPRWDQDEGGATLLAFLSGARWRLGFSEAVNPTKAAANRWQDGLLTHVVDDRALRHEARYPLQLLGELGWDARDDRLEIWTTPEDEAFAASLPGVESGPLVAMHVGARIARRRWPADRFAAVARTLHAEEGATVVLLASDGERHLAAAVERELPHGCLNLAGCTLPQWAAMLRRCRLFVGNDSGPKHLAAAAGIPVVEISSHPRTGDERAPVSPARFGPWGVPHFSLQPARAQAPCSDTCRAPGAHCILGVSVGEVVAAARKLWRPPGS